MKVLQKNTHSRGPKEGFHLESRNVFSKKKAISCTLAAGAIAHHGEGRGHSGEHKCQRAK